MLSLKVVLADGRVIETGTRARKSSAAEQVERFREFEKAGFTDLALKIFDDPMESVKTICERIVPQFVVIVEVFVAEAKSEHALRDEFQYAVLDEFWIAMIGEATCEPPQQSGEASVEDSCSR